MAVSGLDARGAVPSDDAGVLSVESGKGCWGERFWLDSSRAIILVVERDPHVRDLEAYFLNEAGYVVEFAADGVGALAMARLLPRIVVTEILVPKLDGLSLCRAIKEDPALADTAVLIFTSGRGIALGMLARMRFS